METGHKELESDLHVYLLIFLYVDSNIFGILVPRGKNSSSSLEIWDFAFDSGTRNCESPSGGNTHFPSRIYKKHFLYSQKYFSHPSMKTHIDFSERLSKGQEMGKQYGGSLPHCCQMSLLLSWWIFPSDAIISATLHFEPSLYPHHQVLLRKEKCILNLTTWLEVTTNQVCKHYLRHTRPIHNN